MHRKDVYLGQETLETVEEWIGIQLGNGAKKESVVKSLIGTERGDLIISKWDGSVISSLSREEQFEIIWNFIEEQCKFSFYEATEKKGIDQIINESYGDMDKDIFDDFITELMGSKGYNEVNDCVTKILASFKPYTKVQTEKYAKLSKQDLQIELVKFLIEHLKDCVESQKKGGARTH